MSGGGEAEAVVSAVRQLVDTLEDLLEYGRNSVKGEALSPSSLLCVTESVYLYTIIIIIIVPCFE